MTSVAPGPARRGRGLRRQWRAAFLVMGAALLRGARRGDSHLSGDGQPLPRGRAPSRRCNLPDRSSSMSAVNEHEIQSHKLWQGTPINRAAYLRDQNQITRLFQVSLRDLRGSGEHALVAEAAQVWRYELTSRGSVGARRPRPSGRSDRRNASRLRQRAGPGSQTFCSVNSAKPPSRTARMICRWPTISRRSGSRCWSGCSRWCWRSWSTSRGV